MKSTKEATMTAGNGTHMKVTSDPLLSSESMQAVAMSGRFVGFILETSTPPSPPWSDKESNVLMDFDGAKNDGANNDDAGIMIDFLPITKPDNLDAVLAVSFESPSTPLSDGDSGISNASEESTVRGSNGTLSTILSPQCEVCKLVFKTHTELESHLSSSATAFRCCACLKTFSSKNKLYTHVRKHSREKPFQCRGCGKNYAHRTTLTRHQAHYCAKVKETGGSERHNVTAETDMLIAQGSYDLLSMPELEPALEIYPSATPSSSLTAPPLTVTPPPSVVPKWKREAAASAAASPLGSTTACRICRHEFHDLGSLRSHSEHHLSLRTCCLCQRVLGNRSKLVTHHRSHTKESPYACAFCPKRFSENSTLRKHEATHGAKNYTCSVCERGFVRKDYLDKHMATHRQTFRCAACTFVCHARTDIEAHVTADHRDT